MAKLRLSREAVEFAATFMCLPLDLRIQAAMEMADACRHAMKSGAQIAREERRRYLAFMKKLTALPGPPEVR